jgi:5'-nucleotidase
VKRLRILVTNDDGIQAPGLAALKRALEPMGDVFVLAPEGPRSATGHAVTLHKPLRIYEAALADGTEAWACSGTPTDCVTLAYDVLMEQRADIAVAGINDGANLGWDITYSGTVMAAMEAAILGIPAIAVSVATDGGRVRTFDPAGAIARTVAERIIAEKPDPFTLINVNVPNREQNEICGVCVTHQGRREYADRTVTRTDPRDRPYYWISGVLKDDPREDGSDISAIRRGFISVTPLEIDMTAHALLPKLAAWWP